MTQRTAARKASLSPLPSSQHLPKLHTPAISLDSQPLRSLRWRLGSSLYRLGNEHAAHSGWRARSRMAQPVRTNRRAPATCQCLLTHALARQPNRTKTQPFHLRILSCLSLNNAQHETVLTTLLSFHCSFLSGLYTCQLDLLMKNPQVSP